LSGWKSLLDGAGDQNRVGKVFSGALECYGALEKAFAARWRPGAWWKRLVWLAGGLRRVGKVFFGTLDASGGLEKSFLARWRTIRAYKNGLRLRFYDASRVVDCD